MKLSGTGQRFADVFGGLNKNLRIRNVYNSQNTEWSDEQNVTAEQYPVFSTRRLRHTGATYNAPAGMITKDALAVVDGQYIKYNNYTIDLGLTSGEKQLVSMGAYLIVFPDAKYLNTEDHTDSGSINNEVTVSGVTVAICTREGTEITYSGIKPPDPDDGAYWLDASNTAVPVLKQWSAEAQMWVTEATTYVKISGEGISSGFSAGDGVTVSEFSDECAILNGSRVIQTVGNGYIVVIGIILPPETEETKSWDNIKISRKAPDMDFVVEAGNRLWGCKYGMVDGKPVNEIYASKLGDFKNWNCYQGLSTDSYAASRGSDGVFTGAITHLGHPLFFKEYCIEKVYPSSNGAHQIVTTEARGVQKGCWKSLAIVGQTLYYKAVHGVCAYTGSLPMLVSDALGDEGYSDARAGASGDLYWISMERSDGTWHMFTYDTEKNTWHREDATKALCFAEKDGEMYYIDENSKQLIGVHGDEQGELDWYAVSGVIGYEQPEHKYVSRFVIRAETEGEIKLELRYDNSPWLHKGTYHGDGRLQSFVLPVPPRRCDHLQYRISGTESCRIFGIATYTAKGSDVSRR